MMNLPSNLNLNNLKLSEKQALERILRGESLWAPQSAFQWSVFLSQADCILAGGSAGCGKMLSNTAKCWTPFGPKEHGDLEVGDQVSNPDGSVARIIAVKHFQDVPLYRVTCVDGASVLAGADHSWLVKFSSRNYKADRRYFINKGGFCGDIVHAKIITTEQLKEYLDIQVQRKMLGKRPYWPLIPLTEPVVFTVASNAPETVRPIDPYVLGLILGDGSIKKSINLTTMDLEIDRLFRQEMERLGAVVKRADRENNQAWSLNVSKKEIVINALEYLGLYGHGSLDKFVPETYKRASTEIRRAIVQGLMDTDGTAGKRGHCSYCSVSKQLAEDFQWLVRSLGFKATITEKEPFYKDKAGERVYCNTAYTVYIQGRDTSSLFHIERKKSRCRLYNGGGNVPMRRIVSIEEEGRGDAVCIQVDHPNGLYLTDDFIVTHNSSLLLGMAMTSHERSVIFRREYKQLVGSSGLISDSQVILGGTQAKFNAHELTWRGIPPNNNTLDFGALKYNQDTVKQMGKSRDFQGWDELTQFSEYQFRFLSAWLRTINPNQRTRIVGATNPPTSPQGKWVIGYWRPWLDPSYPKPAKPGELRYFVNIDGRDIEVDGPEPYEGLYPQSRTFIPGTIRDNVFLGEAYERQLQGLPDELRRALLHGDFGITLTDDNPFQLIKFEWVRMAQARWAELEQPREMTHLGVDVARGGKDKTVFTPKYGNFIGRLLEYSGRITKRGNDIGVLVVDFVGKQDPVISIDSIGVGGAAYDYVFDLGFRTFPVDFSTKSYAYDRSGRFKMRNKRAELYWALREALDPDLGGNLALPDDDGELMEELTSIHYDVKLGKIQIESKDKIKERLGRSPNRADSLAYAMSRSPVVFA